MPRPPNLPDISSRGEDSRAPASMRARRPCPAVLRARMRASVVVCTRALSRRESRDVGEADSCTESVIGDACRGAAESGARRSIGARQCQARTQRTSQDTASTSLPPPASAFPRVHIARRKSALQVERKRQGIRTGLRDGTEGPSVLLLRESRLSAHEPSRRWKLKTTYLSAGRAACQHRVLLHRSRECSPWPLRGNSRLCASADRSHYERHSSLVEDHHRLPRHRCASLAAARAHRHTRAEDVTIPTLHSSQLSPHPRDDRCLRCVLDRRRRSAQ